MFKKIRFLKRGVLLGLLSIISAVLILAVTITVVLLILYLIKTTALWIVILLGILIIISVQLRGIKGELRRI
jgi:hypothetical protein